MDSFSAHADADELLDYVNHFDKSRLQNIFLVHGEEDQQNIFSKKLKDSGFAKITIPKRGDEFEI